MSEMVDEEVDRAYYEKFGLLIPIGPWHGVELVKKAELEARRAIKGERGILTDDEFPMDCPEGCTL